MLHVFGAAEWRETFRRTQDASPAFRKALYGMYLLSNTWRFKRNRRLEMDGERCQSPLCFRVDSLEVHHTTYENIGDEDVEKDLVTLCERCHAEVHGLKRDGSVLIQLPSDIPDYADR
jgi:hypothetical protein